MNVPKRLRVPPVIRAQSYLADDIFIQLKKFEDHRAKIQ